MESAYPYWLEGAGLRGSAPSFSLKETWERADALFFLQVREGWPGDKGVHSRPGGWTLCKEQDLYEKAVGSSLVTSLFIVGGSWAPFPTSMEGRQGSRHGEDWKCHNRKVYSFEGERRST